MMLFALILVLGSSVQVLASLPKCDSEIIENIYAVWGCEPPTNIISNAKANGREDIYGCTEGYYPDYVSGVFSYFVQDECIAQTRVDIYEELSNGTCEYKYIYVTEENGTTYQPDSQIRRYHVVQDVNSGVTANYVCSEAKDAVCGTAVGFVKVRAFNYDETCVSEAIKTLESVGVCITTYFNVCNY